MDSLIKMCSESLFFLLKIASREAPIILEPVEWLVFSIYTVDSVWFVIRRVKIL